MIPESQGMARTVSPNFFANCELGELHRVMEFAVFLQNFGRSTLGWFQDAVDMNSAKKSNNHE